MVFTPIGPFVPSPSRNRRNIWRTVAASCSSIRKCFFMRCPRFSTSTVRYPIAPDQHGLKDYPTNLLLLVTPPRCSVAGLAHRAQHVSSIASGLGTLADAQGHTHRVHRWRNSLASGSGPGALRGFGKETH